MKIGNSTKLQEKLKKVIQMTQHETGYDKQKTNIHKQIHFSNLSLQLELNTWESWTRMKVNMISAQPAAIEDAHAVK